MKRKNARWFRKQGQKVARGCSWLSLLNFFFKRAWRWSACFSLAMRREHYLLVNGYSTNYWGWGGEDDDMYARMISKQLKVERPPASVARYKMLKHTHQKLNPARMKVLRNAHIRIDSDGVNNVKYQLLNTTFHHLYTHFLIDVGEEPKWRIANCAYCAFSALFFVTRKRTRTWQKIKTRCFVLLALAGKVSTGKDAALVLIGGITAVVVSVALQLFGDAVAVLALVKAEILRACRDHWRDSVALIACSSQTKLTGEVKRNRHLKSTRFYGSVACERYRHLCTRALERTAASSRPSTS